jgi:putative ABC transport system permease protein
MLATGLTTALLYMQTSQQAVTEHAYAQHLQADLVISSPAGGLPLGLAAQVSRLPGVAASPLVTSNGFINVPAALLAPHTTSGLAEQVLVSTAPHAGLGSVEHNLSRLAADIQVSSRSATLAAFSAQEQTGAWVNYMFIAALIAYVTVSLISSTVAATARRRPQLQMLRRIGASGRQVGRAMTIEAALVAAAGIVLGTLVALAALLPFDSALGAPGLPAGPLLIYLAVTALAAALTIAVTSLSAQLLRTAPSQA